MPLMTVAAISDSSTAHAWEAGTATALCGREVLGLRSTGQLWPPSDGVICRPCYRAQQARAARPLWPRLEQWLDLDAEPRDVAPTAERARARISPGLIQLIRARMARGSG